MRAGAAFVLALVAAPLTAREAPQPALEAGETLEVQVSADLDADGAPDLAYVARGEEKRELRVMTRAGRRQVLALDAYPLGDAALRVKGNVLLLEDLTGGTTAVASTHRFRWDGKMQAMRLIGVDATLYSRTYAHDGREASWNLLTGDLITRRLKLDTSSGDAAYAKVGETRRKRRSKPLRLENSPSGDDLLGWPCGRKNC